MKRTVKTALVAATAALSVFALGACSSGGSASTQSDSSPKKIGYMIWDTSVPFYSNLIASAKAEAKKLGATIDIRTGNGDLATEVSVVQQFVSEGDDLIMISPSDPQGIVPAVRQANAANIPVMAVNTKADTSSGAKVITYVGVDDEVFGENQAKLLVKAIGETGTVGYIEGELGTSAEIARSTGLKKVLAKYPGIKIVATQAADWDNAKALAATQDMLNKYPSGQLSAIVGQGPETVTGAKYAFQNGRKDVKFILGDYPADVREAIKSGSVYGTVEQDPAPQGTHAVKYAVDWLDGKESAVPTPTAYIPMPLITKDNVDKIPAAWG